VIGLGLSLIALVIVTLWIDMAAAASRDRGRSLLRPLVPVTGASVARHRRRNRSDRCEARGTTLLVLLAVIVSVAVVWFRSPGRWVDALLLVAVLATVALLALVMLG
jgi:hypothetical protein